VLRIAQVLRFAIYQHAPWRNEGAKKGARQGRHG